MLKEYEVEVERTEWHKGSIIVEAENEEEAQARANEADYEEFDFMLDSSLHEITDVEEIKPKCPCCKVNELRQPLVLNALSRTDEYKYICNQCGIDEAFDPEINGETK